MDAQGLRFERKEVPREWRTVSTIDLPVTMIQRPKVFQSSLLRISIPDEEPNKVLETADLVNLSEVCVRCG